MQSPRSAEVKTISRGPVRRTIHELGLLDGRHRDLLVALQLGRGVLQRVPFFLTASIRRPLSSTGCCQNSFGGRFAGQDGICCDILNIDYASG